MFCSSEYHVLLCWPTFFLIKNLENTINCIDVMSLNIVVFQRCLLIADFYKQYNSQSKLKHCLQNTH